MFEKNEKLRDLEYFIEGQNKIFKKWEIEKEVRPVSDLRQYQGGIF